MATTKIIVDIDADLEDLIPKFLENRRNDVQTLQALIENNDVNALAQLAHKIKGSSASYGFIQLSSLAHELEKAVKNDVGSLDAITNEMKIYLEQVEVHYVTC